MEAAGQIVSSRAAARALEKLVLGVEVSTSISDIRRAAGGELAEVAIKKDIESGLKPLRGVSGLKEVRVRDVDAAKTTHPGDEVVDLVRRAVHLVVAEMIQVD